MASSNPVAHRRLTDHHERGFMVEQGLELLATN
jgi:hypothetical protein